MRHPSTPHVKAARALVGWKQEDLSQASDLSLTSIRNFEMGHLPRESTLNAIHSALENAGLEFIEGDGVRRRSDGVIISCRLEFRDMEEKTSGIKTLGT